MTRTEKQQAIAEKFGEAFKHDPVSTADCVDIVTVAAKLIAFMITRIAPNNPAVWAELANGAAALIQQVLDDDFGEERKGKPS